MIRLQVAIILLLKFLTNNCLTYVTYVYVYVTYMYVFVTLTTMLPWIPSAIAAGASLVSNVMTNRANKNAAQNAFNQEKDYSRWLLRNQTQEKVKDLRSAGLNPAFMNGSQLGAAPPAPSYTPPSFGAPADLSTAILSGMRVDAEVNNIKANTAKVEQETDRQKIENNYLPALLAQQVNLLGTNIDLNISKCNLTEEEAKQVAQNISESEMRISNMVANLQLLHKQADILTHEEKIKAVEAAFKSDEMKAVIANYQASANLSNQQASDIAKSFVYRMYGLVSDAELKGEQKNLVYWDAQSSHLHYNLDDSYGDAERIVGIVNGSVQCLEGVGNTALNFLPAGKAAKLAKFGHLNKPTPGPSTPYGYSISK